MYKLRTLYFAVIVSCCLEFAVSDRRDGVLEKIKAGLQYATNYLEKAKDIADLVSKSLGHKQTAKREDNGSEKAKQNFGAPNVVGAFFRLLGLDSQKVAAIAINSVIFLAQTISTLFELKTPNLNTARSMDDDSEDTGRPWDPMNFILKSKNERIQHLIKQAQDQELPNQLIERVDGLESACIKLFLCKSSPVILAAQKSLKNRTRVKSKKLTSWLPSKDEFEENSEKCEEEHSDCRLFPEAES